jgi:uncharacterized membrane protein YhaH (DUF805 family)
LYGEFAVNEDERHKQEYLEFKSQFQKDFFIFYKGRIKRKDYFLIGLLFGIPLALIITYIDFEEYLFLGLALALFILYFSVCLHVKRFHDIGLSGWYVVPYLLLTFSQEIYEILGYELNRDVLSHVLIYTLLSFVFSAVLIFCPSQKNDNQYGRYYPYSYVGGYKTPKA